MPQFILTINLGNDGMKTPADISTALSIISDCIQNDGYLYRKNTIRDINGNVVGHYEVV